MWSSQLDCKSHMTKLGDASSGAINTQQPCNFVTVQLESEREKTSKCMNYIVVLLRHGTAKRKWERYVTRTEKLPCQPLAFPYFILSISQAHSLAIQGWPPRLIFPFFNCHCGQYETQLDTDTVFTCRSAIQRSISSNLYSS